MILRSCRDRGRGTGKQVSTLLIAQAADKLLNMTGVTRVLRHRRTSGRLDRHQRELARPDERAGGDGTYGRGRPSDHAAAQLKARRGSRARLKEVLDEINTERGYSNEGDFLQDVKGQGRKRRSERGIGRLRPQLSVSEASRPGTASEGNMRTLEAQKPARNEESSRRRRKRSARRASGDDEGRHPGESGRRRPAVRRDYQQAGRRSVRRKE